jgi:predicted nuclease with RNAse H fold
MTRRAGLMLMSGDAAKDRDMAASTGRRTLLLERTQRALRRKLGPALLPECPPEFEPPPPLPSAVNLAERLRATPVKVLPTHPRSA